ncbi:MAG: hypothetical protein O2887_09330 [Bacteroidetes bacterium]|nr:hypothetical protein [Bacteroidota bacterium]
MDILKNDWLTDGLIDFEFKKYTVLAYLKTVKENFRRNQLFPFLSDLVFHYNNLMTVRSNKELIYENFPKTISRADFKKLKITYKTIVKDDDLMIEIEDIISYTIPQFENTLNEGKEIYEFIESNVSITTVGVTPIYSKEGYLMLNQGKSREVNIYRYKISIFQGSDEEYRGINTEFLLQSCYSLTHPFEKIKLDLIRLFKEMPNPATFLVRSNFTVPVSHTLLPVAKRILIKEISKAA